MSITRRDFVKGTCTGLLGLGLSGTSANALRVQQEKRGRASTIPEKGEKYRERFINQWLAGFLPD